MKEKALKTRACREIRNVDNPEPVRRIIERCIKMVSEIRQDWTTYDTHVHPTEFFFNSCTYTADEDIGDLFSRKRGSYTAPCLEGLEKAWETCGADGPVAASPRIARMFAQKTYNCTGPKCFSDFFDLNGIDKGMLLTVATRSDGYQEQLDLTHRMFGGRKRFLIAGSVPNCIANGEVENYLERVFVEKAISAVKVHPNACGLDLAAAAGKERLERILAACSRLGLPLVIHTGRSSFVEAASSNLADIRKFQDLNLNGKVPVVLAHAGAYGCPLREMEGSIVVVLKRILDRSLNVLVDVSALGREKMAILFSRISSERVLFGSDALYENQCVMLARLVCAMEKASAHPSEDLVTVLCKNPAEYLFRENPQKERLGQ